MPRLAPRWMKMQRSTPSTSLRASSERSGRVVSATQSKGAERSSHMAASFDCVRHMTPDSAQDASRGIFRTAAHAGRGATAGENLTPDPSPARRGEAAGAPPSFAGKGVGGLGAIFRTDAHAGRGATADENHAGWTRGFSRFGGRRQKPADPKGGFAQPRDRSGGRRFSEQANEK
jgi:hypothetical protein